MCTLTVVTRDNGYSLGMNRDEQLTRGEAVPPTAVILGSATVVYPTDKAGGTWVGANDHGIGLALLNFNDVPQPSHQKVRSRGDVIPSVLACAAQGDARRTLEALDLEGLWPFRLVGVFPTEKNLSEWRWDQHKLESQSHPWKPRHWFSSSLSDERASAERGAVCALAWNLEDAGSWPWLRRLHASHANGPGPFSLCVHRETVGTLSYTEIECGTDKVECRYFPGSPCTQRELADRVKLSRRS